MGDSRLCVDSEVIVMKVGAIGKIKKRYWAVFFLVLVVGSVLYQNTLLMRDGIYYQYRPWKFRGLESLMFWDRPARGMYVVGELDKRGIKKLSAKREVLSVSVFRGVVTEEFVAELLAIKNISLLYFDPMTTVDEAGLELLGGFEKLGTLSLNGESVDDAGLRGVGKMVGLRHLDLVGAAITDVGIGHLIDNEKLMVIGLIDVNVTDDSIESFEQMKSLKILTLKGTGITEAGLSRLKESRPKLTVRSY